ncbi:MAG: hypothetical protein AAGC65_11310 [Mucilaginibacter sp.]|uniref:hypothetical protein n=1 Tax=Mucilaginibacter sp. TaxID=1882438 RepID=UPI0031B26C22
MKVENPVALQYILSDELYLLGTDKPLYEHLQKSPPEPTNTTLPEPEATIPAATPITEQAVPEVKTQPISFNYLGKNLKNFLVLVHYPDQEFIAEAHLTALQNILKRKELELHDIAILNMAGYSNSNFTEITSFFKPTKLLLLGKTTMPQGIATLQLNKPQALDGLTALYSFAFAEMMDSVDNKKAFWEQMKTL